MITKKRLTKLINDDFRRSILNSISREKKLKYKIPQFARYTVDSCIVHRNAEHENDKAWNYGYTPIQCLAACMKDGGIQKRFFEFNSVNHFLKNKDGDRACEVVEAILIEWLKEDKNIEDFDMDRIDSEFARIEAEYVEEQNRTAAVADEIKKVLNEYGEKFDSWPVKPENLDGIGKTLAGLLEPVKKANDLFDMRVSLNKTVRSMLDENRFCVTVAWKFKAGPNFKYVDAFIGGNGRTGT